MTTMAIRHEPELIRILNLPVRHAVAAVIAIGRPVSRPTRLRRRRVDEFATVDTFDGAPLESPD